MNIDAEQDRLHRDLKFQRLNPAWAKIEIVLGLAAAIGGLLCAARGCMAADEIDWLSTLGGGLLHVLGGYVAMAGHRSHLYQSQTKLTAYVLSRIEEHRIQT